MSEKNSYQVQALNHLNEKYDEPFEVISHIPKSIDVGYDEIICKNTRNEKIRVLIYDDENNYEIHDDYYGTLKKAEYKNLLSDSISAGISEYKHFVSFRAGHFDNEYTKDISLSVALKENPTQFYCNNYIFVSETVAEQFTESAFDEICNDLKSRGYSLYLAVYKVSDSDFAEINEDESIDTYLSHNGSQTLLFKAIVK
ncbi:MAG: hypothetical protein J6L62_00415 [Clostridia bacterium]|nr:hypothetical protein [Clostridia bacterium]